MFKAGTNRTVPSPAVIINNPRCRACISTEFATSTADLFFIPFSWMPRMSPRPRIHSTILGNFASSCWKWERKSAEVAFTWASVSCEERRVKTWWAIRVARGLPPNVVPAPQGQKFRGSQVSCGAKDHDLQLWFPGRLMRMTERRRWESRLPTV